jgi:competence protein ComEC
MKTEVKPINNSRLFYTLFSGFIFAVFVCSFVKISFDIAIFILLLATAIFVYGKFKAEAKVAVVLISVFVFSFALGVLRYDFKEIRPKVDNLASKVGQKVELTGIIIDEPNIKEKNAQLTVEVEGQKVLVSTGLLPVFKYGDEIKAKGKLEVPENYNSTTSPAFDYVGFLAKDDIYYQLNFASAWIVSSGHGSFLKTKLFAFKNTFMGKINTLIREPESSLLGGLLLGAKNSLGKDLQEKFRRAGVSHIVALSGYNITIVVEGIMLALSFLPRSVSLSCGALGIFLFAIMTGGSATVLRASIMALLVLLAKATGRTYDVIRALFLAGLFMIAQNPKILVFDVSFQLSFLSTMALIFVSPLIESKFQFITEKYKLRELVLSTIATQIFVLPFIFYKMGMISIVSLPTNILILPIIPTIMLFGFVTGMMALISVTLALPFAFITSLLLSYELKVIDFFASLPFAALSVEKFPLSIVVIIYIIFAIVITRSQIVSRRQSSLD